ncbi:hypothetical protein MJG53_015903 [Ovis ammon polii x Ovis aries]|uniref:Uncharacterized protein n=1 Tax=Ovis ammon polii x Ovis aries TaxID=2918886 RepID=A0ACB9UC31_9CETA|nr:hypothetical protein MJG53_015903 [Ovis ammon polii x Ovis aries]
MNSHSYRTAGRPHRASVDGALQLFLLWFEGDKVFMLLTISSAVLRVNTVSSSGGRDFLRRERRAWVQPLVRALRSHKLHGIARGKNEEAFLIVLTGKCAGTAYSHKTLNLCFARHICKEAGYSVYSIQHLVKYKSCVLIIMQPLASCIIITNLENDIEPLRQVDEMARGKALECGWKEAHQNSPEELSNTHHDENLLLIASLTPTLLYPSPEGSPLINLDGSDTYQLGGALAGHYWDLLLIVLWIFVTVSKGLSLLISFEGNYIPAVATYSSFNFNTTEVSDDPDDDPDINSETGHNSRSSERAFLISSLVPEEWA